MNVWNWGLCGWFGLQAAWGSLDEILNQASKRNLGWTTEHLARCLCCPKLGQNCDGLPLFILDLDLKCYEISSLRSPNVPSSVKKEKSVAGVMILGVIKDDHECLCPLIEMPWPLHDSLTQQKNNFTEHLTWKHLDGDLLNVPQSHLFGGWCNVMDAGQLSRF